MDGLGLKTALRSKILEPFWKYRGDETSHGPGVPISLERFLRERPDGGEILKNSAGQPISWNDIYRDMGHGPYDTYLNNLVARDDDFRFLMGPLIEDMVLRGYAEADEGSLAWWRQLCARTGIPAKNEAIKRTQQKWIGEPKFTGEGEDLPVVRIQQAEESLAWKKKGCMIRFSLEFLMTNPIPAVEPFIVEQSMILQHQESQHCASTLVNGDIASGANAAPVIGIDNTTTGLQYRDFLVAWNKGGILGRRWFTILSGETVGLTIENLDEFKKREAGGAMINVQRVNRPSPAGMDHFLTEEVPENQFMLHDKGRTLQQRVFLPLHVEGARYPENLTQAVSVATSTTYELIDEMGRVILDVSKAFSANGFPAWFKLGGSRL